MQRWFLSILFLPSLTFAQSVQITEIAPHTLALEPEWFEFSIETEGPIDLNQWQIGNGEQVPKKFRDFQDSLKLGAGVKKTAEPLVFEIDKTGYFTLQPSPISLPNDGGSVEILDQNGDVMQAVKYPKTKSRSTKDYEEREIWNWNEDHQSLMPQLVRAPETAVFSHSQGQPNTPLPTPLDRFKIVINEVSIDHEDTDYIELLITTGPDKINLQYLKLKHNGTALWYFEQPHIVEVGDFLVFKVGTPDLGKAGENRFHSNARDGLSGGSGTVEVIGLSGTSLEQTVDVVCWQKKSLSQAEQKRVNNYRQEDVWREACVNISELIPNESFARNLSGSDANTADDWTRHFNGSLGLQNKTQNQSPQAAITLQGSKKAVGEVSFQVNPTGENSTDPDGNKDIKSYWWELNDEFLSDKSNPAGFKIETPGEYSLRLTVTDQSGAIHTAEQLIVGLTPVSRNANSGSAKAQAAIAKALIEETFNTPTKNKNDTSDDFFSVFLQREDWTESVLKANQVPLYPSYEEIEPAKEPEIIYETDWPRQINLPIPVRQRAAKNLGILFSWRESPWPDLAAEWTAVVANDQKFGYFGGVYLGF